MRSLRATSMPAGWSSLRHTRRPPNLRWMGAEQELENVIAAAEIASRTESRAWLVLLDDGNRRALLEVAGAGAPAVEFLPRVTKDVFPAALGAADVLLVSESPEVAQMAVPSKLTSFSRSRKAIFAATDATGFTAGEIAASGARRRMRH